MISVEEARQSLGTARVEHANACRRMAPYNEQERCRMSVVRAEERLAAAEFQARAKEAEARTELVRQAAECAEYGCAAADGGPCAAFTLAATNFAAAAAVVDSIGAQS